MGTLLAESFTHRRFIDCGCATCAPHFIRKLSPQDLLRLIARPVSEALNGSTIDLLETLEGPALAIKPPGNRLSLSDGYGEAVVERRF